MPRIIFSLVFELEPVKPSGPQQLIAPLDAHGQARFCRAAPPKQRVIDLRVGDWVRLGGTVNRPLEGIQTGHLMSISSRLFVLVRIARLIGGGESRDIWMLGTFCVKRCSSPAP